MKPKFGKFYSQRLSPQHHVRHSLSEGREYPIKIQTVYYALFVDVISSAPNGLLDLLTNILQGCFRAIEAPLIDMCNMGRFLTTSQHNKTRSGGKCLEMFCMQGQVITSRRFRGMWLLVPDLGTCFWHIIPHHCSDVIMSTMASQITSLTIVYSTVYSDADQRKHQSTASLAFVRGIHGRPVNSPHKWPVTRKIFPFDDVIVTCV